MESLKSLKSLNDRIVTAHNPKLVDPTAAPNGNIIYHLYSDGTITYQKGGDAYGQRTMFDLKAGDNKLIKYFSFPIKGNGQDTYAILTQKECVDFREEMFRYL